MGSCFSASESNNHLEDENKNMPVEIVAEEKITDAISVETNREMKEESSKINRIFVWFLEHTDFLSGSEIARLFCLNKAVNEMNNDVFWKIKSKRTYPLNKGTEVVKAKGSWKQYYQRCYDLFGRDGELNFVQIVATAKDIRAWMKENAPRIHETLNDGVDVSELSRLLKTRGCTNRGHLAFWTEIDGQSSFVTRTRFDYGFFGGFEFYHNKGNMHLLSVKKILESNISFQSLRNYNRLCHCIGYGVRSSRHTIQLYAVLMKDGSLRKIISGNISNPYPQGGGDFVGFIKWYRDALYKNEFRIERTGAINRMPRNDRYGSETITDGLRIRVRTLYVPETNIPTKVTITYEFELDCAPGQSPPEGVLTSRHFEIGEDGDIKRVDGEGVIGLYPRIGPAMKVFRYNSCTRFSRHSRDCWMQGSFEFRLASGRNFVANINRFYFKWRVSPIV
jgi:uncharacterized protein affecting Mg2+/Co2+ transport